MTKVKKSDVKAAYMWALVRISLGLTFLWAFFDKLVGLGFATCRDAVAGNVAVNCSQAWSQGGSPTTGFLTHGTKGPFAESFQQLAGLAWVDWLFMLGLLGVGIGLICGIAMRLSVWAGSVMLLLMYFAALLPANNPVIDDHIVYALVLMGLHLSDSEQALGLQKWWLAQPFVKKFNFLR